MLKKVLIIGFAGLIVSMLLTFLFGAIFPGLQAEYQNESLFRPWSDPLMTVFFAYPFIFAITASYLWKLVGEKFKGNAGNRANQFAVLYFVIATIPGMFASYTTFAVSFPMVLTWAVSGFIDAYIAGYVFAKVK
jgi:hypothetical protein